MKPDKITNHAALIISYLLSDLQSSPKLKELMEIFAAEIQSLEDVYNDLINNRLLDTAEGVQLDAYGKIVVWPRNGLSDDAYRKMIKTKIMINCGHGLAKQVIAIMFQMVDAVVWYVQRGRAHYSLFWEKAAATSASWQAAINSIMDKISPCGVSWELLEGVNGSKVVFRFDTPGAGYDLGGFCDRIDT